MASSSPSPSSAEEQQPQPQPQPQSPPQPQSVKECVHKTKLIQFLGRTTPVVLQNDNGPCPLLAICNILLLRNNLNLSPDTTEVSQEKLLSLVAERLIDSNSNANNKDASYIVNQEQNISDAIDLLPRLATGIDVNIQFRRIDDFEFTPECAIFDLLDIPLYHGWIVDPQDYETADAIGSKSYNAVTGELVALETQNIEGVCKNNPEEDCIDFAAATTAALGVPSPCLSKATSFDDSPRSVSDHQKGRKGDIEEEEELLRALMLSAEISTAVSDPPVANISGGTPSVSLNEGACLKEIMPVDSVNGKAVLMQCSKVEVPLLNLLGKDTASVDESHVDISRGSEELQKQSTFTTDHESADKQDGCSTTELSCLSSPYADSDSSSGRIQHIDGAEALTSSVDGSEPIYEGEECILDPRTAVFEDREPVYEGEMVLAEQADKSTLDASNAKSKDEITPHQGELIRSFLKNNASQLTFYGLFCLQDGLKERELCVFFRNNHFSTMFKVSKSWNVLSHDLIIDVAADEMPTYDGELYLLATDQGYINQPDLVWEKLNEVVMHIADPYNALPPSLSQSSVPPSPLSLLPSPLLYNHAPPGWGERSIDGAAHGSHGDLLAKLVIAVNGDTLFMTGNFKEFKVESHANDTWDEHNAMTSTADYISSMDSAAQAGFDMNSDLQLAIALQQQEFEQQPPPRNNLQQPPVSGGSKLVVGPQDFYV
uniref:MINDY deubiquitinase domain-containing protein n=1 Tax=Fagus sylvatica TaxID=28930 RepID=A0A2N9H9I8_FAGSY